MSLKGSNVGQGRQTGSVGDALNEARAQQQRGQEQRTGSAEPTASVEGKASSPFNWNAMASFIPLPASASQQSEVLGRIRGIMENEIKNAPDANYDVSFLGIDKDEPGVSLGVSVLVCCVQAKNARELGVGYHTMLLESSAGAFRPRLEAVGQGRTVEVPVLTGDAYDAIMIREVHKKVASAFPNTPLFSNDARVVSKDFNMQDDGLIKRLRGEVVMAAAVALVVNHPNFKDFTLAHMDGVDNSLSLNTSFHNPQTVDSIGHPVRADIRLDFRTGNPNTNPQSNQSQNLEKVRDLTHVGGFIDFIHQARAPQNPYAPAVQQQWQPGQPSPFIQFLARFVITRLRAAGAPTLTQQLLSLVTVYTLRQPMAWYPAFKPQFGGMGGRDKEIDLRDVGALNIEANLMNNPNGGERMITKTDGFTERDLGQFLSTIVDPRLIVSMDVEDCGSDTYFNAPFAFAASGNQEAYNMIYDAADYLTGGHFSRIFARGKEICFNENNRIHMGYYTGGNGEHRDIRDLDYLALLNLTGERDRKISRVWTETQIQTQYALAGRLDSRLNIIRELIPSFELTGWATRVTFDTEFLEALTQAVGANNVSIREVSPFTGAAGFEQMQYQFANQALGGYQQTNTFTRGYAGPQGTVGSGRMSRWS